MFGDSIRWDLMEIQVLKIWTDIIKMIEEELLPLGSFTPLDISSTSKSKLGLKN